MRWGNADVDTRRRRRFGAARVDRRRDSLRSVNARAPDGEEDVFGPAPASGPASPQGPAQGGPPTKAPQVTENDLFPEGPPQGDLNALMAQAAPGGGTP